MQVNVRLITDCDDSICLFLSPNIFCKSARNRRFGIGVGSGCFRFIGNMYLLAISMVDGLAAPKPPSQVVMESSCSCRVSGSGSNSVSGTTLIPRPSGARDSDHGRLHARYISLERASLYGCWIGFPGR